MEKVVRKIGDNQNKHDRELPQKMHNSGSNNKIGRKSKQRR
jgi:hypothetical protein